MKRLLLISVTAATGRLLATQIQNVLGDAVSIEILPIESGELPPALSADLILVARRNIAPEVNRRAGTGIPIVVHTRTLWRKDWQDLMAMAPGTRLLVVHNSLDNAMAYMATLYELGVRHLDLYPYAPGADLPEGVDSAITPGITGAVPPQIARVRDFGPRPLDAQTILEVMVRLDILGKDARTRLQEWTERTVTQSSGLIAALTWISELQQQTEVLLDFTQTGMITVDQAGTITQFNRKAEELLNRPVPDVVGTPLRALFPSLQIDTVLTGKGALINRLITAGQQELSLSCVPLRRVGRVVGAVTILHALQPDAALAISRHAERGHRARYTFSDIVGQSPALRSTLVVARQMAHSDSTVMIGGETGSGKEMLAQAIHNASWRRHGPFVAVNLAALTESLMESELFGYEEGSFTGAARGGRRGLFELAQQGTIFLDEIGDSTPAVQARLLRVLEERQVMRVGGGRLIPVDVRVIAATNRDLNRMVKEGSFRADLFYRLSVLPLTMPPLRERTGDIAVLAKHFLDIQGYRAPLPSEILAVLARHAWPGNLRELRNCVEFMVTVSGGGEITAAHLPTYLYEAAAAAPVPVTPARSAAPDPDRQILELVSRSGTGGQRLGRSRLAEELRREGFDITEGEVRGRLARLTGLGLLTAGRGRQASRITEAGRLFLRQTEH